MATNLDQSPGAAAQDGVTATCNLLAALSAAFMANGDFSGVRTLLTMFEGMNEGTIADPNARARLSAAVAFQRAILEQMGR